MRNMNKPKDIKIEKFESLMAWFNAKDKGRPVEIDWIEKDGTYKGSIIYYRKDRGHRVKAYGYD